MAKVNVRPETGALYFDFRYRGVRCREQTTLADTPANRKVMQLTLERIEAEITLGTLNYRKYFPSSSLACRFDQAPPPLSADATRVQTPLFRECVATWLLESEVRWRKSTSLFFRHLLDKHLLPAFGDRPVSAIDKPEILGFRASLADTQTRDRPLSPKTINHIMGLLHAVMAEFADRHDFKDPMKNIKRLKVPRKDIDPFTLPEVKQILAAVRADYRPYLTVRIFTALRSGEANGLKWKHVDWERRQILIRETYANGRTEYTKTDGSQRDVDMSNTVFDALKAQQMISASISEYVFCNRVGGPIDSKNFIERVWAPLLRHLGLKVRRPYQMRHTCATLWLGAGENPEWIARQLGHTTTEMLFRVYSRFVPNLTRRDGSAFDRLVSAALNGPDAAQGAPGA